MVRSKYEQTFPAFFAPTTDAHLGLPRILLGLDLVDRVVFWMLPVDDPLPWLLVDRRAVRLLGSDGVIAAGARDDTAAAMTDAGAAFSYLTEARSSRGSQLHFLLGDV
jgi:hypothetical protein